MNAGIEDLNHADQRKVNGISTASGLGRWKAQVQAPASKLSAYDGVPVNQSTNTSPYGGLSSPISVSSHPIAAGFSVGSDRWLLRT